MEIANRVRFIGWIGMIGVMLWLTWRGLNDVRNLKENKLPEGPAATVPMSFQQLCRFILRSYL